MIHEIIEGGLILIIELSYKHPWAVVAVQRLEQQPAGLEMGLNPAKYWDFSSLFLSGFPLVKWIVIIQVTPGDASLRILIYCN